MIEYEIAKPLLACFDQIARWDGIIVGTALRKVRPEVIASALRGLDKESRERIIENLPHRVADDVIDWIDTDEKSDTPRLRRNTRQSRKKIVNTILGVEKQFKKGKFSCGFLLKD
jgi:flagellar motor switch protein FliG